MTWIAIFYVCSLAPSDMPCETVRTSRMFTSQVACEGHVRAMQGQRYVTMAGYAGVVSGGYCGLR